MRLWGSAPVVDDRGEAIRARGASVLAGREEAWARPLAKELRRAMIAESRRFEIRIFLGGLISSLALLGVLSLVRVAMGFGFIVLLSLVVIVSALQRLASRRLVERREGGRVAASIVARGLCGGCGYSLGGLAPEEDGCVVCPECAAAWNAARITLPQERPRGGELVASPGIFGLVLLRRPGIVSDRWGVLCRRLTTWLLDRRGRRVAGRRGLRRRLRREGRAWRLAQAVVLAALASVVAWFGWWHWVNTDEGVATVIWIGAFLAAMAAGLVVVGEGGVGDARVAAICAEVGVCPCCGAGLAEGEIVVCEACGTTWERPA